MTAPRLLSLAEVADRLGLAPKTLRNRSWAAAHDLPHPPLPPLRRLGRRLVCTEAELTAWVESLPLVVDEQDGGAA